jgi:hypothetical protein
MPLRMVEGACEISRTIAALPKRNVTPIRSG